MTSMVENKNFPGKSDFDKPRFKMCAKEETSHFSTQIQQPHRTCLKRTCNDNLHVIDT